MHNENLSLTEFRKLCLDLVQVCELVHCEKIGPLTCSTRANTVLFLFGNREWFRVSCLTVVLLLMLNAVTLSLIRKRAEHNNGEISSLEEISLHQQEIEKFVSTVLAIV